MGAELGHNWKETALKFYYVKKSLQLLDILRGGKGIDRGGLLGCGGRASHQNSVTKKFQGWNGEKFPC
jgi:hypothetical protein